MREQAKHPGPSAAENGQQRAAEFAFATSFFATSRSLAAAKKPTGRGPRTPHGQTEAAKRADRPLTRAESRAGGRQKRAKGRGPGHTGIRKMGKKRRGQSAGHTEMGKGTGPDTRADRNRQRALEEASTYLLILTHPKFLHCPFWYQKDSPSPFPPNTYNIK